MMVVQLEAYPIDDKSYPEEIHLVYKEGISF
jgi:hypothetical protein